MQLFTPALSSNAKRVRVCAEELGVVLEPRVLDFQNRENRADGYLALNPMGKAPTLVDGTFALWESSAILCYLARSRCSTALWPDRDARALADVLRWMFFCACHIDPCFDTLVFERLIKPRRDARPDEQRCHAALEELARFLPIVEQQLADRDYLTGPFGLADIALGCTLELAPLVALDLAPYPHVRRWLARLQSRPSWNGPSPAAFRSSDPTHESSAHRV